MASSGTALNNHIRTGLVQVLWTRAVSAYTAVLDAPWLRSAYALLVEHIAEEIETGG